MKNNKRIYLDFASQTMPSKGVLKEMNRVRDLNFNPSALYQEAVEAEQVLEESREKISGVLGVRSHEIYFTTSATLSCATAIHGLVRKYKEEISKSKKSINSESEMKPHIITSSIEHAAVLENVRYLEIVGEIEASYIDVDESGIVKVADIIKEIKENTILISIMYVNNEVGTIQEIKNIGKAIKEWKKENGRSVTEYPYFHTDASQAGNYLSLYINRLGVDMLSLNGSKIYGPKSTGLLMKREYVDLSPVYLGGSQERGLFSGTIDVEKAAGLATAIVEAQEKTKDEKFLEKVAKNRNAFLQNILKEIPEVKINAHYDETQSEWMIDKKGVKRELREAKRLPSNISLWLPDFPSDEMVIRMDERGFAISAGSACSAKTDEYSHVIYEIAKNYNQKESKLKKENFAKKVARETIRISIDGSTKEEDLESFVKELKRVYYKFIQNKFK